MTGLEYTFGTRVASCYHNPRVIPLVRRVPLDPGYNAMETLLNVTELWIPDILKQHSSCDLMI